MLNFEERKIRALRDKKKNSNSRVVRKKNSEQKKSHNPPCKLNGRSLSDFCKSRNMIVLEFFTLKKIISCNVGVSIGITMKSLLIVRY